MFFIFGRYTHTSTIVIYNVLAIFIEKPTPFMEEFWQKIDKLVYDKSSIDLFIHNTVEFHQLLQFSVET